MKGTLLVAALLLGVILVVGSSGNFRVYTADRATNFDVVSGEESYVGFACPSGTVNVETGAEADFRLVTVRNLMDVPMVVHVEADFSGLPEGTNGSLDEPNAILQPGEETNFTANVRVGNFSDGGLYEIPVTIHATWNGGSAEVEACSALLNVSADPIVVEKRLVLGNRTFPVNTPQRWVMEVRVKNNGEAGDFTVMDFVDPLLFKVTDVTVSKGSPAWAFSMVLLEVHLNRGESVTMRITVENVCWFGHCSTACAGNYTLNEGACVHKDCCHPCGGNCCMARSNGITVEGSG